MEKEFKQTIKVDCPYCREYNGVVMCMDYVIPCEQNVARGKCKVTEVYTKLIEASLAGCMDDLALYGRVTYGNENLS